MASFSCGPRWLRDVFLGAGLQFRGPRSSQNLFLFLRRDLKLRFDADFFNIFAGRCVVPATAISSAARYPWGSTLIDPLPNVGPANGTCPRLPSRIASRNQFGWPDVPSLPGQPGEPLSAPSLDRC
jgi:hypothetical protein